MNKTNIRRGKFELRSTECLTPRGKFYLEIVCWEGSSCYTVASWAHNEKEDYFDLHFCGDRPFYFREADEHATLWKLMEVGQKMLERLGA